MRDLTDEGTERELDDSVTRVTRIIIRRRETWLMKILVGLDAVVCYRGGAVPLTLRRRIAKQTRGPD